MPSGYSGIGMGTPRIKMTVTNATSMMVAKARVPAFSVHSPALVDVFTTVEVERVETPLRGTSVSKSLRLLGVEVSHQTVYNWIEKYTELMRKYVDKITPQVSDTWRADELFLKVSGDMKYLYAIMDNDTRFWLAQEVADTKGTADITPLFRNGKKIAGKTPHTVITDGAFNFHTAWKSAYWRENKALAKQHIRHMHMP